ncbi:MAG TPA: class I SAM-dependent methyltransferase [Terriglobia bacterium]|nr:class I SAM-dependent methyltransferase [Terriglobia bacterium]
MNRCPLCQSEACHLFKLGHTTVYRCLSKQCGLRFAWPQMDAKALEAAYRSFYYPGESVRHGVYSATPLPVLQQLMTSLGQAESLRGQRLLDFGCGEGDLCLVAAEHGMVPTGIEYDDEARRSAAKRLQRNIYKDFDALELAEPDAQFDYVVLWEVIEHLRSPWLELSRLRQRMNRGAKLIISTPNADCLKARLLGARWSNYLNPTHFYYFDRVSLHRTLERAGFVQCHEWLLLIQYPSHHPIRRRLHSWLVRHRLHGALLFVAENPGAQGHLSDECLRERCHAYSHCA